MVIEVYDSSRLNFVELNYTGDNDNFIRCDKESKYLDSTVFNLFAECYENANKLYEYYGPTKYNARKIIVLRNELIKYKEEISSLSTCEAFLEIINGAFLGREFIDQLKNDNVNVEKEWKSILDRLIKIIVEMIQLTEFCADEEKILWVAGY